MNQLVNLMSQDKGHAAQFQGKEVVPADTGLFFKLRFRHEHNVTQDTALALTSVLAQESKVQTTFEFVPRLHSKSGFDHVLLRFQDKAQKAIFQSYCNSESKMFKQLKLRLVKLYYTSRRKQVGGCAIPSLPSGNVVNEQVQRDIREELDLKLFSKTNSTATVHEEPASHILAVTCPLPMNTDDVKTIIAHSGTSPVRVDKSESKDRFEVIMADREGVLAVVNMDSTFKWFKGVSVGIRPLEGTAPWFASVVNGDKVMDVLSKQLTSPKDGSLQILIENQDGAGGVVSGIVSLCNEEGKTPFQHVYTYKGKESQMLNQSEFVKARNKCLCQCYKKVNIALAIDDYGSSMWECGMSTTGGYCNCCFDLTSARYGKSRPFSRTIERCENLFEAACKGVIVLVAAVTEGTVTGGKVKLPKKKAFEELTQTPEKADLYLRKLSQTIPQTAIDKVTAAIGHVDTLHQLEEKAKLVTKAVGLKIIGILEHWVKLMKYISFGVQHRPLRLWGGYIMNGKFFQYPPTLHPLMTIGAAILDDSYTSASPESRLQIIQRSPEMKQFSAPDPWLKFSQQRPIFAGHKDTLPGIGKFQKSMVALFNCTTDSVYSSKQQTIASVFRVLVYTRAIWAGSATRHSQTAAEAIQTTKSRIATAKDPARLLALQLKLTKLLKKTHGISRLHYHAFLKTLPAAFLMMLEEFSDILPKWLIEEQAESMQRMVKLTLRTRWNHISDPTPMIVAQYRQKQETRTNHSTASDRRYCRDTSISRPCDHPSAVIVCLQCVPDFTDVLPGFATDCEQNADIEKCYSRARFCSLHQAYVFQFEKLSECADVITLCATEDHIHCNPETPCVTSAILSEVVETHRLPDLNLDHPDLNAVTFHDGEASPQHVNVEPILEYPAEAHTNLSSSAAPDSVPDSVPESSKRLGRRSLAGYIGKKLKVPVIWFGVPWAKQNFPDDYNARVVRGEVVDCDPQAHRLVVMVEDDVMEYRMSIAAVKRYSK
jgi:hypothetical protein